MHLTGRWDRVLAIIENGTKKIIIDSVDHKTCMIQIEPKGVSDGWKSQLNEQSCKELGPSSAELCSVQSNLMLIWSANYIELVTKRVHNQHSTASSKLDLQGASIGKLLFKTVSGCIENWNDPPAYWSQFVKIFHTRIQARISFPLC